MNATVLASATWEAWGTTAVVCVTDSCGIVEARALLATELRRIDGAASHYREDSELAAAARAGGAAVPVSPLLQEMVRVALDAAAMTGGLVTPTPEASEAWRAIELVDGRLGIPPAARPDLGATGKAFAADRAAARIAATLTDGGVLVSLGGDLATAGPAPDGGWCVRVTDDHRAGPEAPGQTIQLHRGALATSGTTVRTRAGGEGHHIVDPRTGRSAQTPWRTISVAAPTCVAANTASTAAIVLGEAAIDWLGERQLAARLVEHGGAVTTVGAWPEPEAQL